MTSCMVIRTAVAKTQFFRALTKLCTTIPRYPIFNRRYSNMCKVYTGYHGTSEIEHGLCACTVDSPLPKARGLSPYRRTNLAKARILSLRTGAQTMLRLSLRIWIIMYLKKVLRVTWKEMSWSALKIILVILMVRKVTYYWSK